MEGGDVKFTFTGDTTSLVTATRQAQTAVGGLATTASSTGATLNTSFGSASSAAVKAGAAFGPLASILNRVSPAAGAAAASVAALGATVRAAGTAVGMSTPVMAALTAALLLGALAYRQMSIAADEAKAATEAAAATAEKGREAASAWYVVQAAVSQRLERARGTTTKAEQAYADGMREVYRASMAENDAIKASTMSAGEKEQAYNELTKEMDLSKEALKEAIELEERAAGAGARLAAAKAEETEAIKKLADALREQSEAMQAVNDAALANADTYRSAMDAVIQLSDDATSAQLTDAQRINEARDDALASLQARTAEGLAVVADGSAAEEELLFQSEAAKTAIIGAAEAERSALLAASAAEYDAWLEEQAAATKAAWADVTASGVSLIGDVSSAMETQAGEMAKTSKKAGKAWFAASQAVALAAAGVNIGLAVTQALTLPPPADAVKVALVLASGALQVGNIASAKPSFHAGGMIDEVPIRALPGEAVLNRQAVAGAGGPAAVAAMNSGRSGSSGGVTVLRLGRLEAREIARTDIRANGLIPAAIRKGVQRGLDLAGRSGRGPVA